MSKPTLAEIYNTLNQLVDAYGQVMAELREMMRRETADAVSAANVWRSAAEAHKLEAHKLRVQLEALRSG